jgi:hypothetical protein
MDRRNGGSKRTAGWPMVGVGPLLGRKLRMGRRAVEGGNWQWGVMWRRQRDCGAKRDGAEGKGDWNF